jgi:hypothetical protein
MDGHVGEILKRCEREKHGVSGEKTTSGRGMQ